jgi:hypothetical protein
MVTEIIQKLEKSIDNLKNKNAKVFFFTQDTKGNAKASIKYIYDMAKVLKNDGFNVAILHEKPDYFGVQSWLDSSYMELEHICVEGQKLEVNPEDIIVVPEIFGYVMSQVTNLPCAKIVLCTSYDYIFETLQPGQTWSQLGFYKCITTSETMKSYISSIMRGVSIDVIEPYIFEKFEKQSLPPKPIVAIHTREQRDSINLIKNFYLKFPQYRWVSFRDMRAISQEEFANFMKECVLSVWIDDISSFGTFPLESMKSGVPVIGKIPRLVPSWLNENNGIWVHDYTKMPDFVADFLQNWFEDNVSEKLYEGIEETAKLYSDKNKFDNSVKSNFGEYLSIRISNFQNELNKQLEQQPA